MKIHHIGVVVSDLDETLAALGLTRDDVVESVYDPVQDNHLHFVHLPANDLWLECVQPVSGRASTARFAAKHGIGLHHLGFEADDLAVAERRHATREAAFALGRYSSDVRSFGGRVRTLFVAVRGLILEYVTRDG